MKKRFACFAAAVLTGCAGPLFKKETPTTEKSPSQRHCLVFIVDGLGGPLANQMMHLGLLPNFKKHLYDRGLWVEEATSVYPSVTAAAMTSVMTGCYPGRHGIVNFQWMDRQTGDYKCYIGSDIFEFNRDIEPQVKTLFQHFPKNETASFGLLISRGAGHSDSLVYTALNPVYNMAPRAHVGVNEFLKTFGIGKEFPRVMTCYEWNYDDRAHRKGARGLQAIDKLIKADRHFGNLVKMYIEQGHFEETYFILISDHGMAPVYRNFYVDKFLKENGFETKIISWNLGESHIPKEYDRLESLFGSGGKVFGKDAVVGAAGGGCATVDLVKNECVLSNGEVIEKEKLAAGGKGNHQAEMELWRENLKYSEVRRYVLRSGATADVLALLCRPDAVDFILLRDDEDGRDGERVVRVFGRNGETRIRRKLFPGEGYFYKYEVAAGKDPLDLADESQIREYVESGEYHSEKTWFEILRGEDYPDCVVQFCQVFDHPRAATLFLNAAKNWSFNSLIKGKHAGPLEEEMKAVFVIAGPGIPQGKTRQARIVDMVPTVLTLLGVPYNSDELDGRPLPEVLAAIRVTGSN